MAGEKKKTTMIMEDQQQAVLFAAGVAALMACLQPPVVGLWAFLALNLLLLAIALTSKSLISSNQIHQPHHLDAFKMVETKKGIVKEARAPLDLGSTTKTLTGVKDDLLVMEDDGVEEVEDEISKEELNRRAEDFIAMFRRHLVSDCARGQSHAWC